MVVPKYQLPKTSATLLKASLNANHFSCALSNTSEFFLTNDFAKTHKLCTEKKSPVRNINLLSIST